MYNDQFRPFGMVKNVKLSFRKQQKNDLEQPRPAQGCPDLEKNITTIVKTTAILRRHLPVDSAVSGSFSNSAANQRIMAFSPFCRFTPGSFPPG